MGEQKRKETIRKVTDAVTRQFTDQGRLMEAGFAAMMVLFYPEVIDEARRTELRDAYFSGAQHLFGSITASLLDEEREPTEDDLRRMSLIDSELKVFIADYAKRHGVEVPDAAKPKRGQ